MTATEAREVRAAYLRGDKQESIAERFGVSVHVIRDICANRTHKDPSYSPPKTRSRKSIKVDEKVELIARQLHAQGVSLRRIAATLNLSPGLVHRIVHS